VLAVPLDVSAYVSSGSAISIRTEANGRRTRSINQVIHPQPRAELAPTLPMELPILENGRICPQASRPFNVWVPATQRWRPVPVFNANTAGAHDIRVTSTARASRGVWSGYASSEVGTLHVTWGEIRRDSRDRPVMGVTSAWVTAAGGMPPAPTMLDLAPEITEAPYEIAPEMSPSVTTEAALQVPNYYHEE